MLNTPVVDVALGLVFCYAALALTVSTITEAIASGCQWRARVLFGALKALLNDPSFKGPALAVFNHALISPMSAGQAMAGSVPPQLPSYIPAPSFAAALIDVIHGAPGDFAALEHEIDRLPDAQLRQFLRGAYAQAARQATPLAQFEALHRQIADWFDHAMERTSGAYKRRAQAWTFGIALVMAVVFNIDSVHLLNALWTQPALTATLAAAPPTPDLAALLSLPVGWAGRHYDTLRDVFAAAAGILVTAVTALFGAPFWFDLLQQFTRLRGTGRKPQPVSLA